MAKMTKSQQEYVSQALITCNESAANTLTFQKLEAGLSPLERVGWILQRVEFKVSAAVYGFFNSTGDSLKMALTVSGQLTGLVDTDPALIAVRTITRVDYGAAASGFIADTVFTQDYSTLQGGGLLVLPNPIYLGVVGTGLSNASGISARLYFIPIELSSDDYFNLVQSRQILINS